MSAVNVNFPGNIAQVATAADLRAIPTALIPAGTLYLVSQLEGAFEFDSGSLASDDGAEAIRPNDRTPLQAGRWLKSADGLLRGPPGIPGTWGDTSALAPAPSDLANLKFFGFNTTSPVQQYSIPASRLILADANGHLALGTPTATNGLAEIRTTPVGAPATRGLVVSHYANGVGSYGLDIRAYAGASTAQVIHVYSGFTPQTPNEGIGLQIDHTKTGTMLVLKNDENPTTSPGTKGAADFFTLTGYGGQNRDQRVTNLATWKADNTILLPDVYSPLTMFGAGLVVNGSTATLGSTLAVNGAKAGQYALNVTGKDNGFQVVTDTNGNNTVNIVKSGTSDGNVIRVVNGGIGPMLKLDNGTGVQKAAIDANGQYFVGTTKVLGAQQPAIANATDAASTQTQLNAVLAALRAHGLIAA